MRQAHAERAGGDQHEADARGRTRRDGCRHREEAAREVAQIVGRREPPALGDRHAEIGLHHGQHRREGKPADAHCRSQGGEPAERDDHGRVRAQDTLRRAGNVHGDLQLHGQPGGKLAHQGIMVQHSFARSIGPKAMNGSRSDRSRSPRSSAHRATATARGRTARSRRSGAASGTSSRAPPPESRRRDQRMFATRARRHRARAAGGTRSRRLLISSTRVTSTASSGHSASIPSSVFAPSDRGSRFIDPM